MHSYAELLFLGRVLQRCRQQCNFLGLMLTSDARSVVRLSDRSERHWLFAAVIIWLAAFPTFRDGVTCSSPSWMNASLASVDHGIAVF